KLELVVAEWAAEQRRDAAIPLGRADDQAAKCLELEARHAIPGSAGAVTQGEDAFGHGRASTKLAAFLSSASSGCGTYSPSIKTRPKNATIGATVWKLSWNGFWVAFSGGFPCTTARTVEPMPMKMMISISRNSPAITNRPSLTA